MAAIGEKNFTCDQHNRSFGQAGNCSSTVEWRPILAQNVRSRLVKQEYWGSTRSPTLGRNYTNVHNVEIHLVKPETWNSTCSFTVGRSHTNAYSAIMHLHMQAISENTSEHITKGQSMQMVQLLFNHKVRSYQTCAHHSGEKSHHCTMLLYCQLDSEKIVKSKWSQI